LRSILEFSLADLPSGTTIDTASLSLYYYDKYSEPSGDVADAMLLRRTNWVETEATWNIYKTGSNWGTAGCADTSTDINPDYKATVSMPGSYGWVTWDVKSHVEYHINESITVIGWRLYLNNAVNHIVYFYDRTATDTSLRPKLVLEYTAAASGLAAKHHYYQKMMG